MQPQKQGKGFGGTGLSGEFLQEAPETNLTGTGRVVLSNYIGTCFRPCKKELLSLLAESLREEGKEQVTKPCRHGPWQKLHFGHRGFGLHRQPRDLGSSTSVEMGGALREKRLQTIPKIVSAAGPLGHFLPKFTSSATHLSQVEKYFYSISKYESFWSLTLCTYFLLCYISCFPVSDSMLSVCSLPEFTVLVFH